MKIPLDSSETGLRNGTFGPPSEEPWDYLFDDPEDKIRIGIGTYLRAIASLAEQTNGFSEISELQRSAERIFNLANSMFSLLGLDLLASLRRITTPADADRWVQTATRKQVAQAVHLFSKMARNEK